MNRGSLASGVLYGALLVFLLGPLPAPPRAGMSVAIVPPYVEKVIPPGSRITDTLSFRNNGDEPVVVSVDFADFGVSETGEVTEQPPGSQPFSLARNIHISPMQVRVVPDQQVFFRLLVFLSTEIERR